MYVQTAIKGMRNIDIADARRTIAGDGLQCNWWRLVGSITPGQIDDRLSAANLDLHVNSYDQVDPATGRPFCEGTPFISLAAGTVDRNAFLKTNFIHPAHQTALRFASDFGRHRGECYLFYCWVIVGLNPAVEVMPLAEEVRELNSYRRYSAFQLEGEIAAKVWIPSRQIHRFERYDVRPAARGVRIRFVDSELNSDFVDPQNVVNIREAF
jgi:hypothetical protein